MNGDKVKLPEELTLRDYFAAKALPCCQQEAREFVMRKMLAADQACDIVAQWAYEQADAMLKARKP